MGFVQGDAGSWPYKESDIIVSDLPAVTIQIIRQPRVISGSWQRTYPSASSVNGTITVILKTVVARFFSLTDP